MAREERCILTNMCMIYDEDRILVQDRMNPDWPGITFPGGHVEKGESFVDSVIREVKEETGLDIFNVRLCGVKQFTMSDGSYRYIVFFFKTNAYFGELISSDEGNVFWIDRKDLPCYALADGFLNMLEVFLNDDLSENYHFFENGKWYEKNV
ncbi:MAG: 8-oxo-dGTP diphosphatase [Clostridia bacterium]|nr:8-oxo-dGTP diphosphatase [Clostridia bacterium]